MDENLQKKAIAAANRVHLKKYPEAKVIFLAGSIIRGEGTKTSDLDLVVLYENLPNAFRESFYFDDFPVEAFVHDAETLNYFLERECSNAFSPLMQMILEGIEIPKTCEISDKIKRLARQMKEQKPPKLSEEEIERFRHMITDYIDDIRYPRSKYELTATATVLYSAISDFYFRSNDLWLAKHKAIPRELKKADPEFEKRFCLAFEDLFVNGKSERVIELAEELLQSAGGFLFDGFKSDAPKAARKAIK
jgi:predicted nucleotidyltransferase